MTSTVHQKKKKRGKPVHTLNKIWFSCPINIKHIACRLPKWAWKCKGDHNKLRISHETNPFALLFKFVVIQKRQWMVVYSNLNLHKPKDCWFITAWNLDLKTEDVYILKSYLCKKVKQLLWSRMAHCTSMLKKGKNAYHE